MHTELLRFSRFLPWLDSNHSPHSSSDNLFLHYSQCDMEIGKHCPQDSPPLARLKEKLEAPERHTEQPFKDETCHTVLNRIKSINELLRSLLPLMFRTTRLPKDLELDVVAHTFLELGKLRQKDHKLRPTWAT